MSSESERLRWTVVVDGPLPGAVNMARDVALARRVTEEIEVAGGIEVARAADGDPGTSDSGDLPAFLRFYAWERPTLSFGRNEPARDRFDPDDLAAAGVDVIRRPTGGRAVLHHREVTYSVVLPATALGGPRATYRRINAALADGLSGLGAEVALAPDAGASSPEAGPCFDLPAGGEVVARGRKLVGSAQARVGKALLQHGSILLHDDQVRIPDLARPGVDLRGGAPGMEPIALSDLLDPTPDPESVMKAVEAAMRAALPGRWPGGGAGDGAGDGGGGGIAGSEGPSDSGVHDLAGEEDDVFGRPEWTWRR